MMLPFFRKIRYRLAKDNQFFKYSRYAIGEIVLVVIGILIALQANDWKNQIKLNNERKELITDLIQDFEETQNILDTVIVDMYKSDDYIKLFFNDFYKERKDISMDSLQKLIYPFFVSEIFEPILSTYNHALISGKINLIDNKNLITYFNEYSENYNSYKTLKEIELNNLHSGYIWDLRKKIGSNRKLLYVNTYEELTHKEVSKEEYLELLNSQLVFATFENRSILKGKLLRIVKDLNTVNKEVLKELKKQN